MKEKNIFIILGIFVAIVLLIGAILQFTGTVNFLSITPLSISNVDIIDGGGKILVYARQGGGSELSIDFTPSALNSFLESKGFKATKSSRLTAKFIDQNIRIPFSTSETEYNTVKLLKSPKSIGFRFSCTTSTCKKQGYTNAVVAYTDGLKCYCVEDFNNGYTLSFNSGYSSKAFKVEWNLDGQTKIMDSDVGSVNFGSAAIIKWQGSLLGSNTIGVPNYDIFHVGSSWYLIDKNADSRVSSAYSTFTSCVNKPTLTKSQYDSCRASYYNVVNAQISSKDSDYEGEVPNVRSVSFDYGFMNVNLEIPTFLPTYTIELDADKVGIVRLMGIPKIVECPSDQLFSEAGSKNINFRVRNDGTTEAGFRAYTECSTLISSNSQEFDIDDGQTKSVSLLLSGGNTGTTTNRGSCKLIVKDANSNKQDSCSFNVEVEYKSGITDCVGDESTCSPDGRTIYQCVDGFWEQNDCNPGTVCSYSGGKAVCIIGDLPDDSFWDKIKNFFKDLFSGVISFFKIIKYIAVGIGVFFSFTISKNLLEDKTKLEKNAILISSLVIGALMAWFLIKFIFAPIFWILLVGILIFKFFGLSKFRK